MSLSKYIIVGSGHAGLSALEAIRIQDTEGTVTLISREEVLPYSPTILPYVVSGQVDPEQIFLLDEGSLDRLGVSFKRGAKAAAVDAAVHTVTLETGETLEYEKLLLATGASPALPSIAGLGEVPYHVLRTLEDAMHLRDALQQARSAIVLGAGLIGMHAAENLAKGGVQVTVVEALPQVLPGYFDEQAAALIQQVFTEEGIKVITGNTVAQVATAEGTCVVSLESGSNLSADLLLVAAGVRPRIEYLAESGVEVDRGIVVDDTMRTSTTGIWAAGDVAQARGFFDPAKTMNATLANAVEQGRIAGMDMVSDSALRPYAGGIASNAYQFFGHQAFSVGLTKVPRSADGMEVDQVFLPTSLQYQKLVFQNDRLVGVSCINTLLDPGIMYQLIRRRVDLKEFKARFAASPLEMGRIVMSKIWQ